VSSSSTSGAGQLAGGTGAGLVDVTMPQMGVSVAEGTIVAWRAQVGEHIEAEQTICEISTDKIDTEVPAPVSGILAEILVEPEQTVPVGTVLARIATAAGATSGGEAGPQEGTAAHMGAGNGGGAPEGAAAAAGSGSQRAADGRGAPTTAQAPERPPRERVENGRTRGRYSPVVQRIAAEHGVDLAQVQGTGRGGRVRKQDVLRFIGEGGAGAQEPAEPPLHIESPYRPEPTLAAAPAATGSAQTPSAPPSAPTLTPAVALPGTLSRMRRQIGEHMKRSLQTAATCTTWIEVDLSRVETARRRLGVTALAFVARATIDALREHPELNAWLEDERYTRHQGVNLGIAVSLGESGLIVPVIHGAHELSIEGLAARIRDLAARARAGQLSPDEVRGGTFTITNPGQYGSIMATPIINQPQVGILDFEATVKRPVVVTDAQGNDAIAIRPITILGLSWDHRALDGAQAAQFLAAVKRALEAVPL